MAQFSMVQIWNTHLSPLMDRISAAHAAGRPNRETEDRLREDVDRVLGNKRNGIVGQVPEDAYFLVRNELLAGFTEDTSLNPQVIGVMYGRKYATLVSQIRKALPIAGMNADRFSNAMMAMLAKRLREKLPAQPQAVATGTLGRLASRFSAAEVGEFDYVFAYADRTPPFGKAVATNGPTVAEQRAELERQLEAARAKKAAAEAPEDFTAALAEVKRLEAEITALPASDNGSSIVRADDPYVTRLELALTNRPNAELEKVIGWYKAGTVEVAFLHDVAEGHGYKLATN